MRQMYNGRSVYPGSGFVPGLIRLEPADLAGASALNADSFHGPSTMLQIGEDAYVASCLDWASRYLYTAVQSVILVAQALGPDAVRSHAAGIGVIWLRLLYRNQACEYALFVVICSSVGLTTLMLFTKASGKPL